MYESFGTWGEVLLQVIIMAGVMSFICLAIRRAKKGEKEEEKELK